MITTLPILVEALRIVILTLIVGLSVVCLTSMNRRTSELEAWTFILICIGCFWRLLFLCDRWTDQLPVELTTESISGLVVGVGLLLFCINTLYGRTRQMRRHSDGQIRSASHAPGEGRLG